MPKIGKHQSVKSRPDKSDNRRRIDFAVPRYSLSFSHNFKGASIRLVCKKRGQDFFFSSSSMLVSVCVHVLDYADIILSHAPKLFLHLVWNVTLNYRKVAGATWLPSSFKHVLANLGCFMQRKNLSQERFLELFNVLFDLCLLGFKLLDLDVGLSIGNTWILWHVGRNLEWVDPKAPECLCYAVRIVS